MKVDISANKINQVINGDTVNVYEHSKENFVANKMLPRNKIKVFISYSRQDEDLKNKLDVHLASLKRDERIIVWNDREILGGQDWNNEIREEINQADLILLLISADFINSDYIWKFELSKAIERHDTGNSIVIPIFCKPCEYANMPFAKLQGLPRDAKPIIDFENIDSAMTEIVTSIKMLIDQIPLL